jgi:hypothetical protein
MNKLRRNILIIESIEARLDKLTYQDDATLEKIGTDVRIVIRRLFGEQSVYWHDIKLIRFNPKGVIANSESYIMTGAWKQGHRDLAELLRAMKTELSVFGDPAKEPKDITLIWLIKNTPWEAWTLIGTIIVSAFGLGFSLAQTTFFKELLSN